MNIFYEKKRLWTRVQQINYENSNSLNKIIIVVRQIYVCKQTQNVLVRWGYFHKNDRQSSVKSDFFVFNKIVNLNNRRKIEFGSKMQ